MPLALAALPTATAAAAPPVALATAAAAAPPLIALATWRLHGQLLELQLPCSDIVLAGTNDDGRYSLILKPADNRKAERTIYQAISGIYLYSLYSQYWMVSDDCTSSSTNQYTESAVDCPTELSTGGWSATCAPPASPPFMGYPDYSCPCSEVTFVGATYPQMDGTTV
tara:strand:- start:286 stop:789 length:504 start_codon:yes stop_codon:yes gene_type:complete